MRRKLSRSRTVALGAALAGALAGCTAPRSSTVTTPGKALTIYTSMPSGGATSQRAQDVLEAEQLALKQGGQQAGGFTITLRTLQGKKISDNARTAIDDPHAIAYLGEVVPGQSADSVGITNALSLPELSPTDTAQALTQGTGAVPGSPKLYYQDYSTYGQTFARLVPTTSKEAAALIEEMGKLGVRSLYVTTDGSDYGNGLAAAVRKVAGSISIQASPSGADAVLAASASESAAAKVFNAAASSSTAVKLFGPSALNDQAFVALLSPAAQHDLYVSSPGFLKSQLTPAGKSFVDLFHATYQHAPAPEAIFGYEAMSAVLGVLRQAGSSANNRATVLKDLLARNESTSVLGSYRLNGSGDTTLAGPFLFSHVRAGQLEPFASISSVG
jgi:ABC-type branched-subunit amino acid transport system substrate-binding protein